MQLVTNAALNAVATGADGRTMDKFKIYFKDMIVTFIAIPVILVLGTTGLLIDLGFSVASLAGNVVEWLSNLICKE